MKKLIAWLESWLPMFWAFLTITLVTVLLIWAIVFIVGSVAGMLGVI